MVSQQFIWYWLHTQLMCHGFQQFIRFWLHAQLMCHGFTTVHMVLTPGTTYVSWLHNSLYGIDSRLKLCVMASQQFIWYWLYAQIIGHGFTTVYMVMNMLNPDPNYVLWFPNKLYGIESKLNYYHLNIIVLFSALLSPHNINGSCLFW